MAAAPLEGQIGKMAAAPPEGQKRCHRFFAMPFVAKIYLLVDDPVLDNLISWNKEGSTFIVWRPVEFAREVLPRFFKHNNFISFVRQLNSYGFRKIVPLLVTSDRWEFVNESFRRGEKHLLRDIRRKVTTAPLATAAVVTAATAPTSSAEEQDLSSNASPGAEACPALPHRFLSINLIEVNEQLRRENLMLREELGKMKGHFDSIMLLMSNYSANQQAREVASPVPVATTIELMPPGPVSDEEGQADEATGTRLFGVAIGGKQGNGGGLF